MRISDVPNPRTDGHWCIVVRAFQRVSLLPWLCERAFEQVWAREMARVAERRVRRRAFSRERDTVDIAGNGWREKLGGCQWLAKVKL